MVSGDYTSALRDRLPFEELRGKARKPILHPAQCDRASGNGRHNALVHVRVGTRAEASVGERPLDTRYLHEHRLMNVAG